MRLIIFTFFLVCFCSFGQTENEPSKEFPFGKAHPETAEHFSDFKPMIGLNKCVSTKRNPDGSWQEPTAMEWRFNYILNGHGIQDHALNEDGSHGGSIRQFIADSSRWYVHYYSNKLPSLQLPAWEGKKVGDKIILYRDQKAPNGMDGMYRITFYDMSDSGFKWLGEWVDTTEKIVYPTWRIECTKQ